MFDLLIFIRVEMSSSCDAPAEVTDMPPSLSLGVAGSTSSTPPVEEGWKPGEVEEYLEEIRASHGLPLYPYRPDVHESVMCCLVPPHLDEVFTDHHCCGGRFNFYPHALLIRDWFLSCPIDKCSWWREFRSEEEVQAAVLQQKNLSLCYQVNELHEHNDVSFATIGRVGHY